MRGFVLSVALASGCSPRATPADVVFVGGPVYTRDGSRPWAEALAVRGRHIAYVGSRGDADTLIGDSTRVIDLDGRLLLPKLDDGALIAIHEAVNGRDLRGRTVSTEPAGVLKKGSTLRERSEPGAHAPTATRAVGVGPHGPSTRVSVEHAISIHARGTLVVGALADLTVLQGNILRIAPERIAETKVEMSVVDGEIQYVAKTFEDFSTTPK